MTYLEKYFDEQQISRNASLMEQVVQWVREQPNPKTYTLTVGNHCDWAREITHYVILKKDGAEVARSSNARARNDAWLELLGELKQHTDKGEQKSATND